MTRPALAEIWRGEQAVHERGILFVRPVGQARQIGRSGRQTREIKEDAADQRDGIGLGSGLEIMRTQFLLDEGVDGVLALRGRHGWTLDRHKGPVILILGSLGDPAAKKIALSFRELLRRGRRRHHVIRFGGGDAMPELAVIRFARLDRFFDRLRTHIEPKACLALVLIRAVAGVALRGEDRAHVAIELDTLFRSEDAEGGKEREWDDEAHALADQQISERRSMRDFRVSVLCNDVCGDGA